MTVVQSKRLDALEGTAKGPMEPMRIIRQIVRPDLSTAGYLVKDASGQYVEMDPNDPMLEGYPPVTPETNGGYRAGEEPGGWKSRR